MKAILTGDTDVKVEELQLPGVSLITPQVFKDSRGYFMETFEQSRYEDAALLSLPKQVNLSYSRYGVIRGMHFQSAPGQAKLVQVVKGRIYDVFVNIDPSSSYFGKWLGVYLDEADHQQLYIPNGYAHGFCCVSESATVLYKVSNSYDPKTEKSFRYNDPDVGIQWPIMNPVLSDRDQTAPYLRELKII